MSRTLLPLSVAACILSGAAQADAPRVAADIAPVHSLVARVMDGVGVPDLIVQPGGSPHEYTLRPSEAGALQDADLVFWISPELTPWLGNAIETLAPDAVVTELLEVDGTLRLEMRDSALFEGHDHAGEDHADAHEDHDDHAHDNHGHDDHAHGSDDTHAWLAPDNAAAWLDAIAGQLAAIDPDNAEAYRANAATGRAEIEALTAEIDATLAPVRGGRFVVFHDAYQYFEQAFDISASGAISLSDASAPSPARIAQIQGRIAADGIECVLAEPQFNAGLVATVLDGTEAATGVLDPLGSDLTPGADLYPNLMRNLAATLAGCL